MSSFLFTVLIIVALAHFFVYQTAVNFLQISDHFSLLILRIVFILLSISFVIAILISFRFDNILTRSFYTIAAIWMGFLLYFVLASALAWVIFTILKNDNVELTTQILFLLAAVVGVYGMINANNVQVVNVEVNLPNLPSQWKGKKLVWISDVHLGQVRGSNFSQKVEGIIKKQNPDMVFIGGDLYDAAANLDHFVRPFSETRDPDGNFFITGNHEEFFDKTKYVNAVKDAGITILNNQMIDVNGLQIIGVDYRDTAGKINFKNVLDKIKLNPDKPSILLKHTPYDLDIAEAKGINFQISGHTHEGQIFPINLITHAVYRGYDYGLKKFGNMWVYTSSGVGTWGPPLRIGSVPEVAVITLE